MELNLSELERMAASIKEWRIDCSWLDHSEDKPAAVVGAIDENGNKYPVVTIDCDQYFNGQDSTKVADFYAAANPAVVLELVRRLRDAEARVTARIDEAVEAEREACAKICTSEGVTGDECMAGQMFAREIYARNQPPRGEG